MFIENGTFAWFIENVWQWYLTRKTVETWLNLPKLAKIDFSSPKSNKKRLKGNDLKKKGSCGYVWKVISATRVRSTTEIDSRDLPRAESRDWLGDKFCTPDQEQLIRDEIFFRKFEIFMAKINMSKTAAWAQIDKNQHISLVNLISNRVKISRMAPWRLKRFWKIIW